MGMRRRVWEAQGAALPATLAPMGTQRGEASSHERCMLPACALTRRQGLGQLPLATHIGDVSLQSLVHDPACPSGRSMHVELRGASMAFLLAVHCTLAWHRRLKQQQNVAQQAQARSHHSSARMPIALGQLEAACRKHVQF